MNAVEISVEGVDTPGWADRARDFALAVLERLGKDGWDLSILLCDDPFIKGLNSQYRDKDEPTDVLSFEQGDEYVDESGETWFSAGDIVISVDSLMSNAREFGVTPDEELKRLLIHGILHLNGMDHATNSPDEGMLVAQDGLRVAVGLDLEGIEAGVAGRGIDLLVVAPGAIGVAEHAFRDDGPGIRVEEDAPVLLRARRVGRDAALRGVEAVVAGPEEL